LSFAEQTKCPAKLCLCAPLDGAQASAINWREHCVSAGKSDFDVLNRADLHRAGCFRLGKNPIRNGRQNFTLLRRQDIGAMVHRIHNDQSSKLFIE
jgi:hypothetical protein